MHGENMKLIFLNCYLVVEFVQMAYNYSLYNKNVSSI